VTQTARVALSAAFAYVLKREAFGHPLIEQAVVRNRIARCGGELEALSAWVDQLVYTMDQARRGQDGSVPGVPSPRSDLGGLLALAKARAGMVLDECARCAVLLFGGNGYTRTGQGELVEKIYREVPAARVPGGSEDVMLDLAIRQLVKGFRARTKALGRQRL
jgi:acyl-CoA dehydrogenase